MGLGFLVLGEGLGFFFKGGGVGLLVLFDGVPPAVVVGGGCWMVVGAVCAFVVICKDWYTLVPTVVIYLFQL